MKLYFHPAACSLAPHIVARELGLEFELAEVERGTHRLTSGEDFLGLNANGYVPVLETPEGILTEGPAIVQHLASLVPETTLVPQDPWARRRMQSLLNFITSELHKPFALHMIPDYAAARAPIGALIARRLAWVEAQLAGDYLMGAKMTLPDPYLFAVTNWSQITGHTLGPRLTAFLERMQERPAVQAALAAEGLVRRPGTPYVLPEAMLAKLTAA
jgi:glutathione S-transferase